MVEQLYKRYAEYTSVVVDTDEFSRFKSNENYTYMLEHVNLTQGRQYLGLIQRETKISDEDIRTFSASNDAVGSPKQEVFTVGVLSPSNLRYLFQAHLILKHMKELGEMTPRIVELGGGYGGLCLAINFLCGRFDVKPQSYTIVDLEPASKLQTRYLSNFSLSYPVEFVTSDTYGKDIPYEGMFFISNYCFSEISNHNQRGYIFNLFPKVAHGFMAWNNISVYDFGFTKKVETEYPLTAATNKYVWF
jgi:putative sugar O-methyltransferase